MGLQVHSASPNYREYAQAPLRCPLDIGVTYYVEMYVNKANSSRYAIDQIGILFSVNAYDPFLATPQIVSPLGVYITDTLNWTLISGTFTADSSYAYITIGNFKNDANTNLIDPSHGISPQCYYLFDDIFISRNVPVSNNPTICSGESVALSVNGNGPYSWSPATGLSTTNGNTVTASPASTTIYSAYDPCSQTTTTFTVTVNTSPVAVASGSTTILEGEVAALSASGNGTYRWSPATGLDCDTCKYPQASPQTTTTYCLEVTAANECSDTACVKVIFNCGELFVPNAFSPNGDGQNETECVYTSCIKTFYFAIFDRWGQEVFTTTDPDRCWDGTYKGKLLNTAVFTYYLEATFRTDEIITRKGNISLIR